VHLKQSKTQLGERVEEFIRKTGCPITAVMAYMNLLPGKYIGIFHDKKLTNSSFSS